ncbi:MAG: cell division protein ZapA [Gemmatimonadaceae bacterium]|nr:cell division protein ZapA [Gemmatimonadaceae bacterium]MDQ3242398.1 cell division protein ZapA [Gemmatimonadota bacterium]
MTVRKNVVKVTILGGEYTLRTETTPEHALAVAGYVDKVITETMESGPRVESHKAAILAALRIAGELFEVREERRVLAERTRGLSEEIKPWLPPVKRHD